VNLKASGSLSRGPSATLHHHFGLANTRPQHLTVERFTPTPRRGVGCMRTDLPIHPLLAPLGRVSGMTTCGQPLTSSRWLAGGPARGAPDHQASSGRNSAPPVRPSDSPLRGCVAASRTRCRVHRVSVQVDRFAASYRTLTAWDGVLSTRGWLRASLCPSSSLEARSTRRPLTAGCPGQ
jgi:hypothetical protein